MSSSETLTSKTILGNCIKLRRNPQCPHGPMAKYTRTSRKGTILQYFSCTAYRDNKDCPFTLRLSDTFSADKLREIADMKYQIAPKLSRKVMCELLQKFKELKSKKRQFCRSCFKLVFPYDHELHTGHDLVKTITNEMLSFPSNFISAKTNAKKEAQYWFDDTTKYFLVTLVKEMETNSVLCIGTPTVHEIIRSIGIRTMLLDIDSRYATFYSTEEFGWFNMFNAHFLADEVESLVALHRLLKQSKTYVFIDPPFGARLELLASSIRLLLTLCSGFTHFFIALPYFMESQAAEDLPEFQMLDYVVHYANHAKMKSHKKSPVRFFTTADPSTIRLPADEGYVFCDKCSRWRHANNKHCNLCKTCPSKNATTYKHCPSCNVCVKSTWEHCDVCERCFLAPHRCHDNPLLKRVKMEEERAHKKKKLP